MGDEILTIGQVKFCKDDVATYETGKAKNGRTLYSVFLKNGTKIRFYDQNPEAKPSVTVGYDTGNENKYGTAFKGIMGMTVEGSDKDDYYHVMDCDYYDFDTEGGGKDHIRVVNTCEPQEAADYAMDKDVDTKVVVNGTQNMNKNEGVFVKTLDTSAVDNEVPTTFAGYGLVQPLAKDIPADKAYKDNFYYQFVDRENDLFTTDNLLLLNFCTVQDGELFQNAVDEADGSLTLTGTDMQGTPVKVNIKNNPDGTTMLKISEFNSAEPNKIQIVDTKTKALLYATTVSGIGGDGEQNFYNADGSKTVYDKDNKLLRTEPFHETPAEH